MKTLFTATLFLSFFFSKTIAQQEFKQYEYKNKLRVGVYVSPKVCLHTKIITDIAHLYVEQEKSFENAAIQRAKDTSKNKNINKTFDEYQKKRFDSADAFDRLFTGAMQLISTGLNKSHFPNEVVNLNDTIFLPLVKVEQVDDARIGYVTQRDSLDYLVRIQNLESEESGEYYIVKYDLLIHPKLKNRKPVYKKILLSFENKITNGNSLLYGCNRPIDCFIANSSDTLGKAILGKIFSDGYYPQLKEPNGF